MPLAENLARIRETLARESAPWGRAPRIVAVTKQVSAREAAPLAALGVADIAENRVQGVLEKSEALGAKFQLHLIGRLQTNKVKYIIEKVCLIQSLDRPSLAQEIDRRAQQHGLVMPVLVQVSPAGEAQKGGVAPEELAPFLRLCAGLPGLRVEGLMAIMPQTDDQALLAALFTRMRTLFERTREQAIGGIQMNELSMGMSGDYALAARAGATMVRIGSAIFHSND